MALLNYRTTQDADKTAGEIANMLRKAGARAVLTEYDESREYVSSLSFKMEIDGREVAFKLPCDWKPVQRVLERQKAKNRKIDSRPAQSVRVAWRIVKDWVEAQLAIIETQMVKTEDVFLPYMLVGQNETLAERMHTNPQFLLTNNKENENRI